MRKLAIVCGAFAAAVFLAHYGLPSSWLFPLALALSLPGIALILLRRRWLLPVILVLCSLAAGFYAYGMHRMLTLDRAHEWDGAKLEASARLLTAPDGGDGWTRAEVLLQLDEHTRLRGLLYDHGDTLRRAMPGDTVEGFFSLSSADQRYGERYDNDPARGIYLRADARGDLNLHTGGLMPLRGLASLLNRRIVKTVDKVFPADTAAFFRALLLGDKTGLYEDDALYLSLSRAGLMHMLAISGMHISYLVGMLRSLLGNTRRASVLSILLVWSFVLLTGATPSAVRAGVMQTLVLFAPLVGREDDPPTSLLLALSLILLVNPFAAGSVSLQLSFASLAGILFFSDGLRRKLYAMHRAVLPRRAANYLSSNLANALCVLVFSVPLIGVYFGYISVVSPLSSILCLWAVPYCFLPGYLCCLLSLVSLPAARWLASVLSWLARYIAWAAGLLSGQGFSCLYLCLKANILWVAGIYVLFTVVLQVWKRGWLRWAFSFGLAVFSLFVLLTATRLYYGSLPGIMTAVNVGQGQSIAVFAGDSTVVVDCGNVNSTEDAGDLTGAYLCSRGRERIDCLVLTHLHSDHADGVLRLMEYLPVDRIILGPDMEDPNAFLPALKGSAERHGTELVFLSADRNMNIGAIRLELMVPGSSGDINERCLWIRAGIDGYELLITGDSNIAAEREQLRLHDLGGTEVLVVGHHGSKYACGEDLLRWTGAETALISCGYNVYGHPTEETLERLAKYGYTVYRTDQDGTVELRVP